MNTKKRKTGLRLGALLLSLCLMMGLLPVTAFAADPPTKRNTYNVYTENVINGGADSQVYAVTIENVDGADLHYVYSPNAINSNELMEQIRAGLEEPYKSLIPTFEEEVFATGLRYFSRDQEKYEKMNLDWKNPEAVAKYLISGSGSVSVVPNDAAISVTDISDLHADEKVVSEKQLAAEDFYTNPPELGQLGTGENRVEAMVGVTYRTETVEDKAYYDVFNTMHVAQISAFTATKEEEGTAPTKKRDTYNVYAENVINGGSDSQVYANTVTVKNGYNGDEILVLHYVYSPNAIHSNELMEKLRAGLSEPYKSLVPTFEEGDSNRGFLRVSQDQEKYESMDLDWGNVGYIAAALTPNRVIGLSFHNNSDTAISVTDISEIHAGEKVVSKNQFIMEDFYEHLSELGQLGKGEDRVEVFTSLSIRTETVEGTRYYDIFNSMHVTQIYSMSAVSVDKIAPVSDPITLPVRVLEEGDVDYSLAPELSATFTPDTAVTVGEFNEFQGLAIDYYYPMVDAELSEGYDIQAGYTVSIPLTDYEGETLSGTLTIPLPQGYDGATARIKGGASASSYTESTVSFTVTLVVSGCTADAFELLIEYKEAQKPVQPPVIIAGANGSWQKSGTDGLSFTSDAEYADFLKVMVDGKELKTTDYTVKEGSTIVTLNAAYLETLSVGKHTLEIESKNGIAHTLEIESKNGIAKTEFTITAAQTGGSDQTGSDTTPQEPDKNGGDTTIPQTGDNSNVLLWIATLFVSGSGLFGATIYRRKRKIK